jgi:hypothetical protein
MCQGPPSLYCTLVRRSRISLTTSTTTLFRVVRPACRPCSSGQSLCVSHLPRAGRKAIQCSLALQVVCTTCPWHKIVFVCPMTTPGSRTISIKNSIALWGLVRTDALSPRLPIYTNRKGGPQFLKTKHWRGSPGVLSRVMLEDEALRNNTSTVYSVPLKEWSNGAQAAELAQSIHLHLPSHRSNGRIFYCKRKGKQAESRVRSLLIVACFRDVLVSMDEISAYLFQRCTAAAALHYVKEKTPICRMSSSSSDSTPDT